MINILSIGCSLAFAPYLAVSIQEFVNDGVAASRVVRQGGTSLIIRTDGELVLRHDNRQARLGIEEALHYSATVQFRSEVYDVLRMQDEVVLASVGEELLLSHPQSEIWLNHSAVARLVSTFASDSFVRADHELPGLPEWLEVSTGGQRLLLSDHRTARWVLLGVDHLRELERRLKAIGSARALFQELAPPTFPLKGLKLHIQSAFKLIETLEGFANTGKVVPFAEVTPTYSLRASRSPEGMELADSDLRVALTAREARKWVTLINAELERLNARQIERGGIRTVFADNDGGRWILQWGDEVFLPKDARPLASPRAIDPISKRIGEFLLLLRPATGACVALTESESIHLLEARKVKTQLTAS